MVFNLARHRDRVRDSTIAVVALILLLAAARAGADTLKDAVRNTVHVTVTNRGSVIDRGVGLFLGTYEGKGVLLTPAHVLGDPEEIGKPGSGYVLEVFLSGSPLRFAYGEMTVHLKKATLADAVQHDYLIVEVPIPVEVRGAIFNLTGGHFTRPASNQPVIIFGDQPAGGFNTNTGQMMGRSGKDVVSFEVKTDRAIEKGESGSPILGKENQILGILTSSDGRIGQGVYPGSELTAALSTIAWSKDNRKDFHGVSLSVAPTYQYGTATQDLGGGTTHTATDTGVYTSVEFEYFRLKRAAGEHSSPKLGLVLGYSNGRAHGIGQVDDADYSVKWGAVLGSIDRFRNDSGQIGLFMLSHKVDGEFVHRFGISGEATWQLSVRDNTAMDAGVRFEINDAGGSSGVTHASFGFGLVFRYSWLSAM